MIYRCIFVVFTLIAILGCTSQTKNIPDKNFVVFETLKKHPEVVMDILRENKVVLWEIVDQGFKVKRKKERIKRLKAELDNPRKPEIKAGRNFLGNLNAPITIVGYSDFHCYYCAKASETIETLIEKYPEKIRFYFKHLPSKELSLELAMYFEAIAEQDSKKAWDFHFLVFGDQKALKNDKNMALKKILDLLEVDQNQLQKDLDSKDISDLIAQDKQEAEKFGFNGTPSFLVNGIALLGAAPLEEFEKMIKIIEDNNKNK